MSFIMSQKVLKKLLGRSVGSIDDEGVKKYRLGISARISSHTMRILSLQSRYLSEEKYSLLSTDI